MSFDQSAILAVLVAVVALFVWGRLRVDVVALLALSVSVAIGVVPADTAFAGFGHPAVITVAAVLGLSAALGRTGVIDLIASRIGRLSDNRTVQTSALCGLGGALSGFMNNVGALALLMPVALSMARRGGFRSGMILMPLAFATILGGMTTLIGTPPNLLVSGFRRETAGQGFGLFDFAWVGVPLALAGIAFVTLVGWRLLPVRGRTGGSDDRPFDIASYLTELRVPEGSAVVGKRLDEVLEGVENPPVVDALIRSWNQVVRRLHHAVLQQGDVLLAEGETESIQALVAKGFELVPAKELERGDGGGLVGREALALMEVVVPPRAWIEGRTPATIDLRARYGLNLLAIARSGASLERRLRDQRFAAGDVLLLQGEREGLLEAVRAIGCLPLAERRIALQPGRALVPLAVFGAAVLATAFGLFPAAVSLVAALLGMVLARTIAVREVYDAIDWQVLVLLAAMIPVGGALESTGAARLLAEGLASLAGELPPRLLLGLLLVLTMTLSDVMNNAATAVVMAPIAIGVAAALGVDADPMLMAVAVGASAAFLTPIGHQNNLLVMGPGGYRFGDYWRMGLPLEVLLTALAVWLIPVMWPF
ncbi:SLC13 family permease [Thalassobaculum fulvum]|uniref:SLC13 family permease n=1 Tax=Thalassobaculum fulvum TaxID=1633335 RepID=A0A919CM01_9PROT|nr:SLC13 family permease [Thalassobaculum fulvum]GHD38811.1 SLC13 family permease [Thalassobaculum fulvum]